MHAGAESPIENDIDKNSGGYISIARGGETSSLKKCESRNAMCVNLSLNFLIENGCLNEARRGESRSRGKTAKASHHRKAKENQKANTRRHASP